MTLVLKEEHDLKRDPMSLFDCTTGSKKVCITGSNGKIGTIFKNMFSEYEKFLPKFHFRKFKYITFLSLLAKEQP